MNTSPVTKQVFAGLCALSVLAFPALSACSSDDDETARVACPRVSVLADASRLTRFAAGSGRDLLDVDYQAEVTDLFAGCRVVTNESGQTVLLIAVAPEIRASRGPANQDQRATFDYFVSVVENGSTILSKATFPVQVPFAGNQRQVVYRDDNPPVTVDLPWTESSDSARYEVVIGFQLTDADLRYNREAAGWAR